MKNVRRFQLDELTLRPGTYFNPQTEVMVVVDDSPEVDHEIFESGDFDAADWVQISEEMPLDEHKRDNLVEGFQLAHQPGGETIGDEDLEDVDEEDEELDADEDEDELDPEEDLDFERE
jgi:hypothetical protein